MQDKASAGVLISAILVVGVAYCAPAYFAFTNPAPISIPTALLAILAFSTGEALAYTPDLICIRWTRLGHVCVWTAAPPEPDDPHFYLAGSAINIAADFYKAGAKNAGQGLVAGGPYTFSLRPNYFGDWLRYSSFALVSGSPWAFLLPAFVAMLNSGASWLLLGFVSHFHPPLHCTDLDRQKA